MEGFSSHRVAEISGLSYRQIDYLTRERRVIPSVRDASGSGSRRMFSGADVIGLCAVGLLPSSTRAHGQDVATAALVAFLSDPTEWHGRIWVDYSGEGAVLRDPAALGGRRAWLVIDVDEILAGLRRRVEPEEMALVEPPARMANTR